MKPPPHEPTDAELVERIRGGDARAFEALYRRHRDWVVRTAYRFAGDEDDALDVLQETFAYLVRRRERLTLTARMTTFLYPVVRHFAWKRARKRRHVPLERAPEPIATDDTPGTVERRELVARLLARLPEAQREVVVLRYLDGLRLEEIADALRVPLGTVKSRLHAALKALREPGGGEKRTAEEGGVEG